MYEIIIIILQGGDVILHIKNRNSDYINLKYGIITYFFLMIVIIFIINNFRSYMKDYNPSNLLYVHLVNYSLPVIKVTSFGEEDLLESEGTLSEQIIKIIGIGINDPMKIMGREISFIKELDFSKKEIDLPKVVINNIDPFNISEDAISKIQPTDKTEGTGTEPNKVDSTANNRSVNVYNASIKKPLNKSNPEVLIYHTHTTESYGSDGNYNENPVKNITSVGEIIASELETNYGIAVSQDKTIHNKSMVGAYKRSAVTLDSYLNKYSSYKLIIDLHRDGGVDRASTTATFNSENVAKILFVLDKKSKYYNENQETTTKLQSIANEVFPGFNRNLTLYKTGGYYNQDKKPNSVLIEMGSEKNTLEEAQDSGKYLARIIAEYLSRKQ